MRYKILCIVIYSLIFAASVCAQAVKLDIDAAKDGPIYGDPDGLARLQKLESQLHAMSIKNDHPRIFITPDTVEIYRERVRRYNPAFDEIIQLAEKGDIVNLAFIYLMREKDNPATAARCAKEVIQKLMDDDPSASGKNLISQNTAKMSLAFDWVYNAMSEQQRRYVTDKLSRYAGIRERAQAIRNGLKESGETFHREEWIFDSFRAWPEIALAHHDPDAEFVYRSRWSYDWYLGDAARMYAYAADGTPFEGYYFGADGVDWFLALRSATGVNLVDGEFGWCKNAAYYTLYRLDMERKREVFHHGVAQGAGGCASYKEGISFWKIQRFLGRTLGLAADNPFIKWLMINEIYLSDWILTASLGHKDITELKGIAKILFDDQSVKPVNFKNAGYEEIPFAWYFPGGNEAYMRTGWLGTPTIVGFRSSPAYTKNSHGDFDVNTFLIYRDGVLSPDSGFYDVYSGQGNYFSYQKNTIAHNNILVIDPTKPDEPKKLGGTPDPGGVDLVKTKSFGAPYKNSGKNVFLHNPDANWADLAAYKTTPYYDYVVGEANKAYRDRLDRYFRTLVFVRKGNRGYLVIYDQLKLKRKGLHIKWLLHLVAEPLIRGRKIHEEVPGHIGLYSGDYFKAKNAFGTSELFFKILKAGDCLVRKVGGSGYEFWVDGSKPRNFPVAEKELARVEGQMGGKWQEAGTWRIELIPQDKKMEYDFINVIYIGDADEPFSPENIVLKEDDSSYNIEIADEVVPTRIVFLKGEEPRGNITIGDKVKEDFPGINKR